MGFKTSYVTDGALGNINALWVAERLGLDDTCQLKSIVIIAQCLLDDRIYEKVEEYFDICTQWRGTSHRLPLLTVSGNTHPTSYCNTRNGNNPLGDVRLDLPTEAFQSGPIHVSV